MFYILHNSWKLCVLGVAQTTYLLEVNILGILQSTTCFRLYGLDVLWTTYVFEQQANQVGVFLPHSAIQRGLFTMPRVHICSNF